MKFLFVLLALGLGAAWAATPEEEVKAAMEAWKKAAIAKDKAALEKTMHSAVTYSHSNAKMETRAQAIEAFMAPSIVYKAMDMEDTTYRVYGKTALVQTKMTVKNAQNGEDRTLPLSVLMVWVKEQGRWQMVARQSTRLP
jgi:ketosteroid isomerase-like protein